jgi:uncharacterized protein YecT (DUF1311 family)
MRILLAAALVLAGAATAPAQAAEPRRSAQFERCYNDPDSTTLSLRQCIGEEFKRQDARLNGAYAQAMRNLDTAAQARLRTAQRAWIAFRDADCQAVLAANGGTMAPMLADLCYLDRTAQRADELEDFSKP